MGKKTAPPLLFVALLILFATAIFKDEISAFFADNKQQQQPIRVACPGSIPVVANPIAEVTIPNGCDIENTVRTRADASRFQTQTFPDGEVYGPGAKPRPQTGLTSKSPVGSVRFISIDGKPVHITVHLTRTKKKQENE